MYKILFYLTWQKNHQKNQERVNYLDENDLPNKILINRLIVPYYLIRNGTSFIEIVPFIYPETVLYRRRPKDTVKSQY